MNALLLMLLLAEFPGFIFIGLRYADEGDGELPAVEEVVGAETTLAEGCFVGEDVVLLMTRNRVD